MADASDLLEENRILRERIERLEQGNRALVDPVLRALIRYAPAFLNVITPEGRSLGTGRTSDAFGSVVGRSVFEFTAPEHHQVVREAFARVCETKQPTTYETLAFGENGEPNHTYLVRAVPMVEHGAVELIVLIPTDITERVRLERSLALSEQKLRLAIDAARMGLWSWDLVHDEVRWDRRALEIFGVSEAPPDYDHFLSLIHPDDRAYVTKVVQEAQRTGVQVPFEHRLAPRGDGLERWALGMGSMVRDDAGNPTMLMGGVLDITAQKHAAAQLQRAQRVEALGQLSAGLAHNFNNLLGAIIPNLELALESGPAEEEALRAALGASFQARDLIKRLMAITAPRVPETTRVCDPREVVERAVALCRASFPREIQITSVIATGVGHVGMSATDLDQVLLNLLFNARDALETATARGRLIEVSVDVVLGEGAVQRVRVCVRDNGIGMSETTAARVFEPFFSTKPAHRGSGLGLADALVRVRDAGGLIDCASLLGEGTTFTVRLPEAPPPPASPAPQAVGPRVSDGETILIVDDEPAVRMVVARLLTRSGYRVLEASDAAEARAVLEAQGHEVKLVLLDQSMPRESGPEALPSLKRLCDAPVVLFTGGITELPPGAAALLEKPAQSAELLAVIRRLLGDGGTGNVRE